jgi:hypothetical protein
MLKIATPVSHLFLNEKNAKKIIKYSDCLELREGTVHLNYKKEHLFHIDRDITSPWNKKFKFFFLQTIKKKKLKLITFQCSRCCSGEKKIDGRFQLSGKIFTKTQMFFNAKININWLKKNISKKTKIGVENNNYYPTQAYNFVTDGDFISELVIKNKIFFLLDLAHAQITSYNKKITLKKYLNSLPLNKTIQMHIVNYKIKKKIAVDTHYVPTIKTYRLVSKILANYPSIQYLTIEYYRNTKILIKSIKKLKKIINIYK